MNVTLLLKHPKFSFYVFHFDKHHILAIYYFWRHIIHDVTFVVTPSLGELYMLTTSRPSPTSRRGVVYQVIEPQM